MIRDFNEDRECRFCREVENGDREYICSGVVGEDWSFWATIIEFWDSTTVWLEELRKTSEYL